MFLFCLVFAMSLCASVYMCFVVTCWGRADLLTLVCGVFAPLLTFTVSFHFPIGILGQVWYLIVSIPDLCTLTYLYSNRDVTERHHSYINDEKLGQSYTFC